MYIDVVLPKWGLTMETAEVCTFLCAPGDPVKKGDSICEVDTDKAVNDLVSPADGILVEWLVEQGEEVAVGAVIARIQT